MFISKNIVDKTRTKKLQQNTFRFDAKSLNQKSCMAKNCN